MGTAHECSVFWADLRHWQSLTIVATLAMCIGPHPARAQAPSPAGARTLHIAKQSMPEDPFVSDADVGKAIEKGAAYLMSQFVNGKWKDMAPAATDDEDRRRSAAADFLAVYALLTAGKAIDNPKLDLKKDPYMKPLVEAMKAMEIVGEQQTYGRAVRLVALSMVNRKEDQGVMTTDIQYMLDACAGGGYSYDMRTGKADSWKDHAYAKRKSHGDNSNSQYALLGVWAAAKAGCNVPDDYWQVVEKKWTEGQRDDGQWSYVDGKDTPHLAMTLAGLASLFVCHDYLNTAKFDKDAGREPFSPALLKGLQWLENGNNSVVDALNPYTAYGVERVGLASGFKYFGTHDWYRELATSVVKAQKADGSWEHGYHPVVDTSLCVLFLSKGRHAILANKLRFEHFWNNRPHDLDNLCKFSGAELERSFNWQVVSTQHDWIDWMDAPVLCLCSHVAPKLEEADYAKIRGFIQAGGLLFTQQDGPPGGFNDFVDKTLVKKLFPDFELTKVPENHELYSAYEQVRNKPPLQMVSNGARVLWVHSRIDLTSAWEQNATNKDGTKVKADVFRLGINLCVYAAGKNSFRNRIEDRVIATPPAAPDANSVKVARIKYPQATWDPEPYSWTRLANWLGWETSVGLKTQVTEAADLATLAPGDVPLAHLTGTYAYAFTDAQTTALRQYVQNGGVLFIDSCGGVAFNESIDKLLAKAFPDAARACLPVDHPLLTGKDSGMIELKKLVLRPYAEKTFGGNTPALCGFKSGKGWVICSTLDVSNALLGSRTWGVCGYDTATAQNLVRNLVIWAATR